MPWRVVINKDGQWAAPYVIPVDPPGGWMEAADDSIEGYRRQRYTTELEANRTALLFRAFGYSAATEQVHDEKLNTGEQRG